jgi:hypothetical protein
MFQVISRTNDTNDNPFRLIIQFNAKGDIIAVSQSRSSSPDLVLKLRRAGLSQLPGWQVTPSEYKAFIKYLPEHITVQHVN